MLTKFYVKARTWAASEEGATAVEYGIMVALIAAFIIGAVTVIGVNLDLLFREVAAVL